MKCIEDEIPFELPEDWDWCRFSSAFIINPRNQLSDDMSVSFVPMPLIQEGYANKHTDEEKIWGSVKSGFTHFANNDVGVAKITPCFENKKSVVFKGLKNGYGAGTTELHIIRTIGNLIYPEYVLWNVKTDNFISNGIKAFSGAVGQKRIGKDFIEKSLIPIAPTNEQKRILECISIAFEYIDSIEASKEAFKVDIQSIKSKILDLAIRGKLVPQNPDDEPAAVLLERIRAEKEELIKQGKIKRDKKESVIFKGEDNSYYEKVDGTTKKIDSKILFDIPENWHWEKLGNICTIARGGSPRPIDDYLTTDENGINWIKIGDTEQGGKYIYHTKEKIKPEGLSKTRQVKSGDFLLTNSMSFGRPYILKTDGCIHDGWLVISDIKNVFDQDFLYYALSSDFMYNAFVELAAGSTVKNLKSDTVRSVLFPVPPLQEQKRIAEHLEKLFYMLTKIEQGLN